MTKGATRDEGLAEAPRLVPTGARRDGRPQPQPQRQPGVRTQGPDVAGGHPSASADGWDDPLHRDPPGGSERRQRPVAGIAAVLVGAYVGMTLVLVTAGTVVTDVVAGTWLGDVDTGITRWLAEARWRPVDVLTRVLSNLADTYTVIGTTVGAVVVLLAARLWRQAAVILAGMPLELAVFLSTTYTVARPRPTVGALEAIPSTASFPSGHMAASIVLYGGLALLASSLAPASAPRRWFWAAAALVAAGVGFSRVYRGLHNTLDVLAGAALGTGCLVAAVVVARFLPAGGAPRHDEEEH